MRVLDACAAPGGKTGHLLELAECELLAVDADGARARRIAENLSRLKLSAKVVVGDAASRRISGGGGLSSEFSWMRLARRRAWCGATPTSNGCAGRPTHPSSAAR